MPSIGATLVLAVIALSPVAFSASASRSLPPPCAFTDSVNLTDYVKLPNGSYDYHGIMIPPHLTGEYNYKLGSSQEHIPEKPNIRGCVCQLKPCVQFCCPVGMAIMNDYTCEEVDDPLPEELNITLSSGEVITENYYKKFAPQFGNPCNKMFSLEPWLRKDDVYYLFENGSLFRKGDSKFLGRNEYCFGSIYVGSTEILTPYNCMGS